ncbi:MAG: hypothetical protein KGJ78_02385 [Alphaproteobacteria bacterium]|nr:hypothetical protein [Alphaproteobacteria bacterium]
METNHVPATDWTKVEPGCCCPRFEPNGWDDQEFHFRDKAFVHTRTHSAFHIPLDVGSMFKRTWRAIRDAHADGNEFIVMSDESAMWHGEHYFSVEHDVPGAENIKLTGDFLTHVFEGPYSKAPEWAREMKQIVAYRGRQMGRLYFYYTTCPKCAKKYGKNYVVGIAQLGSVTN